MNNFENALSNYLLDSFPSGIYQTDKNGKFIYFNKGWKDIMGEQSEEFSTEKWLKMIHPDDLPMVMVEVEKSRAYPSKIDIKYRIYLQDGTLKFIRSHANPVYEEGQFQGYFGSLMDETESYLHQQKYQLSQTQYSDLLNTISDIVIIHLRGIILYVNQGGCDVTEYSKEEIIGSSLLKFTHPKHEETIKLSISDIEKRFFHNEQEMTILSKSGKEYRMIPRSKILLLGEQEAIATLLVDVTSQKQTEMELIRAKNAAEELAKAKSEFISIVSHEIKTPLNGIIGLSKIIQMTNKDSEQIENIEALISSGETLNELVKDVLDYSKLDSGYISIRYNEFELNQFLNNILIIHRGMASSKGLSFEVYPEMGENIKLKGDQQKLAQVLNNILNNAIKFTDKGKIRMEYELNEIGNKILFHCKIIDTGIGIATLKRDLIFTKFYQAQDYSNRKFQGSGLGLAIVKSLIDLLGGKISFESIENIGSSFYFEIPFEKA